MTDLAERFDTIEHKQLIRCASRNTAKRRCPWAAVIAKVDGGFLCFEYVTDYDIWRRQS